MKHEGFANRTGLDFRFFDYEDNSLALDVDYVNSVSVEISADHVAATGGADGAEQVIFDEAIKGTFKMSTQIIPLELIALAATSEGVTDGCTTSEKEEVTAGEGGAVTLTGTPVAGSVCVYPASACKVGIDTPIADVTVAGSKITIPEATAGTKYVIYYFAVQAEAKTVTFSDNVSPKYYSCFGKTLYKGSKNSKCAEYVHCYKLRPQKNLSLTYQGSGDPMSLDITCDIMSNEDGKSYETSRLMAK